MEEDDFDGVDFEALFAQPSGEALQHRAARAVAASMEASSNAAAAAKGLIVVNGAIPPRFRGVFPYEALNRVQSRVFSAVFLHDGSIAVAAPTGTGKTLIFELAVVRALLQRESSEGDRNTKFVYLAPLRALCAERRTDWQRKFGPLGLRVACVTGDAGGDADEPPAEGGAAEALPPPPPRGGGGYDSDREAVSQADIIITTPEKWDSMTRRWRDNTSLIRQIVLLCLDEVHLLGDDRGAVLEAVVARMQVIARSPAAVEGCWPASHMRIVAVSATLPNVTDVGRWIGAPPENSFSFDASYRPVPLTVHVVGYDFHAPNAFLFEKYLETRVYEVVVAHSSGRPSLVFCASRNGTRTTAECLVKDALINAPRTSAYAYGQAYSGSGAGPAAAAVSSFFASPAAQGARARCIQAAAMVQDKRLADCLRHGVGYHSAGEASADRASMERLFGEGSLPVLCTTSTLAMGVNLPAHLVIIKSTQAWRGSGQGYTEYPASQLLQMMGRAGRPQFDTSGTAVIMTHAGTQGLYRSITSGSSPVESTLGASLVEHVVSEVTLRTVTSVETGMDLLRSTFLNIRMRSNPAHYRVPGATASNVDAHLKQMFTMQLFAMHQAGLIQLYAAPRGNGVGAAPVAFASGATREVVCPASMEDLRRAGNVAIDALAPAHIMSRNYLRFDTMVLLTRIGSDSSVVSTLLALCHAREIVSSLVLRRDEKKALRDIKEHHGRVPCKKGTEGTVSTVHDKAFQLLQDSVAHRCHRTLSFPPYRSYPMLQAGLGRVKLDSAGKSFNLRMEMHAVLDALKRIVKAFVQYCSAPGVRSTLLPVALVTSRVVYTTLWENAEGPQQLLLMPGVTEAIVVHLCGIGVNAPDDLLRPTITPAALDAACRKQHPFGQLLKAAALSTLPRLGVTVSQRGTRPSDGAALLKLVVSDVTHKLPAFCEAGAAAAPLLGASRPAKLSAKGGGPMLQLDIREYMRDVSSAPAAADKGLLDPRSASVAGQSAQVAAAGGRGAVPIRGSGSSAGRSGSVAHSYHLCVTSGDADEGLLFDTAGIAAPSVFEVAVQRPGRGPRVHIHLVHASVHGLDMRLLVEPKYGPAAVPKVSLKSAAVSAATVAAAADMSADLDSDAEHEPHVDSAALPPSSLISQRSVVVPQQHPAVAVAATAVVLAATAAAASTTKVAVDLCRASLPCRGDPLNDATCDDAMLGLRGLIEDAMCGDAPMSAPAPDCLATAAANVSFRAFPLPCEADAESPAIEHPVPAVVPPIASASAPSNIEPAIIRRRKPGLSRKLAPSAAIPAPPLVSPEPTSVDAEASQSVFYGQQAAVTTPPPAPSVSPLVSRTAHHARLPPTLAIALLSGADEANLMVDRAMAELLGQMSEEGSDIMVPVGPSLASTCCAASELLAVPARLVSPAPTAPTPAAVVSTAVSAAVLAAPSTYSRMKAVPSGFEDDDEAQEVMRVRAALGLDGQRQNRQGHQASDAGSFYAVAPHAVEVCRVEVDSSAECVAVSPNPVAAGNKRLRAVGVTLLDAVQAQCAGKMARQGVPTAKKNAVRSTDDAVNGPPSTADSTAAYELSQDFCSSGPVDDSGGLRVLAAWTGGHAYVDADVVGLSKPAPKRSAANIAVKPKSGAMLAAEAPRARGLPHAVAGRADGPPPDAEASLARLETRVREVDSRAVVASAAPSVSSSGLSLLTQNNAAPPSLASRRTPQPRVVIEFEIASPLRPSVIGCVASAVFGSECVPAMLDSFTGHSGQSGSSGSAAQAYASAQHDAGDDWLYSRSYDAGSDLASNVASDSSVANARSGNVSTASAYVCDDPMWQQDFIGQGGCQPPAPSSLPFNADAIMRGGNTTSVPTPTVEAGLGVEYSHERAVPRPPIAARAVPAAFTPNRFGSSYPQPQPLQFAPEPIRKDASTTGGAGISMLDALRQNQGVGSMHGRSFSRLTTANRQTFIAPPPPPPPPPLAAAEARCWVQEQPPSTPRRRPTPAFPGSSSWGMLPPPMPHAIPRAPLAPPSSSGQAASALGVLDAGPAASSSASRSLTRLRRTTVDVAAVQALSVAAAAATAAMSTGGLAYSGSYGVASAYANDAALPRASSRFEQPAAFHELDDSTTRMRAGAPVRGSEHADVPPFRVEASTGSAGTGYHQPSRSSQQPVRDVVNTLMQRPRAEVTPPEPLPTAQAADFRPFPQPHLLMRRATQAPDVSRDSGPLGGPSALQMRGSSAHYKW